jgi:hypothetical protein
MGVSTEPECIEKWADFIGRFTVPPKGKWLFRGVLSDWKFKPSLERVCEDWGVLPTERPLVEKRLLREFKRAYPPRAEIPAPRHSDDLAWLALMQHYGAPTRLLDWTFSPFIAAFFALDLLLSSKEPTTATVWALSDDATSNAAVEVFLPVNLRAPFKEYSRTRCGPAFRKVFLEADPPFTFVSPVNPYVRTQ